jgi:hypothetical protein
MTTQNKPTFLNDAAELEAPARIAPTAGSTAPLGPLTEAQIDPHVSAALRQALPGLTAAFDEQLMLAYLGTALFEPERSAATIERCEVDQATYLPDPSCIIRYLLTLRDGASGETRELLVSGRLFPDQVACEAYARERLSPLVARVAGREEIAVFTTPIATIGSLHMAVHAFPIDADLPSLIGATDRRRIAALLGEVLQDAQAQRFAVEDCRAELVDYGRQHRATLRYHVTGRAADAATSQNMIVYGKLTGDGSGALAGPISAALREQVQHGSTGYRFNVPRVLAWRPELQLSLLEAIPGEGLIGDALKALLRDKPIAPGAVSIEEMIEACARIAATLHTSGIQLGRRRTFDDELASLRKELGYVQPISPDLGARLAAWLEQIASVAARSEPLPLCFNHGDFTYGQILFDGAMSGLVDFDSVSQAEPALDLGQFLTYLQVGSLKSKLTPAATQSLIDRLSQHFLDTYLSLTGSPAGGPAQLLTRVSIYKTLSLFRRSLRSWQKFKPGRIESALALLEAEIAGLSRST